MFTRLQPVLGVPDLRAEIAFYRELGFEVVHEEDDFVGLAHGGILFGLQRAERIAPRDSLVWQFGAGDVHAVHAHAVAHGLVILEEPRLQDRGDWTLRLATPAGYVLVVEGGQGP